MRGIEVFYEKSHNTFPIESRWNENGATCLSKPRLPTLELPGYDIPEGLPDELQPEGCKRAAAGATKCDAARWADELRAECKTNGRVLEPCTSTSAGYFTSKLTTTTEGAKIWTFARKGDKADEDVSKAPPTR